MQNDDVTKKLINAWNPEKKVNDVYSHLFDRLKENYTDLSEDDFYFEEKLQISSYLGDIKLDIMDLFRPIAIQEGISENYFESFWMHVLTMLPPPPTLQKTINKGDVFPIKKIKNSNLNRNKDVFSIRFKKYRITISTELKSSDNDGLDEYNFEILLHSLLDIRKKDVVKQLEEWFTPIVDIVIQEIEKYNLEQ